MAIETFTLSDPDIGEVEFEPMSLESINQQWGLDDSRIQATYKIPWAERFMARDLLLGRTIPSNVPTAHLKRTVPHKWLEDVKVSGEGGDIYASRIVQTVGLDKKAQPDCYEFAAITVLYEGLPYDVLPDDDVRSSGGFPDESGLKRWVELGERTIEAKIYQSYGQGAVFCGPNDAPDLNRAVTNGAPYPYYEQMITLIWHQVPRDWVPWQLYQAKANTMNSVQFGDAKFCGLYPAKTLLFIGASPVMTRVPNQTRAVNVRLKFKHNRNRWDFLPDPANSFRWTRVVMRHDTTKTLFEESDFRELFRPAVN